MWRPFTGKATQGFRRLFDAVRLLISNRAALQDLRRASKRAGGIEQLEHQMEQELRSLETELNARSIKGPSVADRVGRRPVPPRRADMDNDDDDRAGTIARDAGQPGAAPFQDTIDAHVRRLAQRLEDKGLDAQVDRVATSRVHRAVEQAIQEDDQDNQKTRSL